MQPTSVFESRFVSQHALDARLKQARRHWTSVSFSLEILADGAAVWLSAALSYGFYEAVIREPILRQSFHPATAIIALVGLVLFLLGRTGAYRCSGGLLGIRETACVLKACFYAAALLMFVALLYGDRGAAKFLAVELPLLAVLLFLEKHATRAILSHLRQRGLGQRRVLIYGGGVPGRMLYSALVRSPKLGLWPVAVVDDGSGFVGVQIRASSYRNENQIVCSTGDFRASLLHSHRADVVVVASRTLSNEALRAVLQESASAGAEVVFAADLGRKEGEPIDYIDLDGQLIYSQHAVRPRLVYSAAMRALEIAICGAALTLTSLPILLIGLVIRLDSPGPALFRQRRVGQNGRTFTILKFRTMHQAQCGDCVSPTSARDSRITRAGKWLRRTSIDELPQLINVLRGEMALVGPRPEMPFIVDGYSEEQRRRLAVKPGITGLWQLSADRSAPIHDNVHYNLYYIKERSVALDLAILVHTAFFAMNGT